MTTTEPTFLAANHLFATLPKIKCQKQPIMLAFTTLAAPELIQTKEGPVQAFAGQVVITGTRGERWPVPADKFAATYAVLQAEQDGAQGTCAKQPLPVVAVQLRAPFSVVCSADVTMKDAGYRNLTAIREFEQRFIEEGYNTRVFDPAGQDDIGGGCGQLWYVQDYFKQLESKN